MLQIRRKSTLIAVIAVLCLGLLAPALYAAIYSIPFFSQKDPRWSGNRLGNSNETIGSKGCAVTSVAMLLQYRGANVDPGKLNTWLTKNSGYDGSGQIFFDRIVGYDDNTCRWLAWDGRGTLPSLPVLNQQLASRKLIIAESKRFGSQTHFVVILGVSADGKAGFYLDPMDTPNACTQRKIGDGWVNVGAGTRVYRY